MFQSEEETRTKLSRWFSRLTPEQRLALALEIEDFKRKAKFVKSREDI